MLGLKGVGSNQKQNMMAASLATNFHIFPSSFGILLALEIAIYLIRFFLFLVCRDKRSSNQKRLNKLPALVKYCLFSQALIDFINRRVNRKDIKMLIKL